jgi:DNA invertase Pin-like site-specific DNA recombinase
MNLNRIATIVFDKMNQKKIVKAEIIKLIQEGFVDKHQIYTKVVESLNVPRPTVRRIARELRLDLQRMLTILQQDPLHIPSNNFSQLICQEDLG